MNNLNGYAVLHVAYSIDWDAGPLPRGKGDSHMKGMGMCVSESKIKRSLFWVWLGLVLTSKRQGFSCQSGLDCQYSMMMLFFLDLHP